MRGYCTSTKEFELPSGTQKHALNTMQTKQNAGAGEERMTAAEASPLSAIKYRKKKFKKSMKVKTVLLRSAGEITHKKKKSR